MKPIIKVENISKQYRLGTIGTGTLSHDITRWWYNVRGKEDPYLKVGESNDRTSVGNSDYVWALKDINFEVKPGEILGIIGKNGAGKSTLLKLLSRVTAPTTGKITSHGRIASLLEVGTGFHPELTGRENIYLNGAILGMTKKEIASKFDEIVEFAGCQKYIETPVKRYSSGMYVRLAFAVAAHLEPDILVVDEVLAVGDAEFQKKAIGKMKSVSEDGGRTVLFVSHNMAAVQQLCTRGILISNGSIDYSGSTESCITRYLQEGKSSLKQELSIRKDRYGAGNIKFDQVAIRKSSTGDVINTIISGEDVSFEIHLTGNIELPNANFRMQFYDSNNQLKFVCNNLHSSQAFKSISKSTIVKCKVPKFPLCSGEYYVNLRCRANNVIQDDIEYAFEFMVENGDFFNTGNVPSIKEGVLVEHQWHIS